MLFEYDGASGRVVMSVDSYRYDPKTSTGVVYGLKVGPKGESPTLEAGRATIKIGNGYDIDAEDAVVRLDRLPDGSFSVEEIAPKQTTEAEPKFLKAIVRNAIVEYRDLTASPTLAETASIDKATIEAYGDLIVATSRPNVSKIGAVPLKLWIIGGGKAKAELAFVNAPAQRVWNHIERWIDPADAQAAKEIQFGDARLTGSATLNFGEKFHVDGDAHFAATNAGYRGIWEDANVSGSILLSSTSADVDVRASDPGNKASFTGRIDWTSGLAVLGDMIANSASSRGLLPSIRKLLPEGLDYRSADWAGKVAWNRSGYVLDGTLRSDSIMFKRDRFVRPNLQVRATEHGLFASTPEVSVRGLPLQGVLSWSKKRGLSGYVRGEKLPIAAVAKLGDLKGLRGQTSLEALIAGTLEKPRISVAMQGAASAEIERNRWIYAGLFDARGEWDGKDVAIERFALRGQNGSAIATGTIDTLSKRVEVDVHGGGIYLKAIDRRVDGLAFVDAVISGTTDRPNIIGNAQAYGVKIEEQSIPAASIHFAANPDVFRFDGLSALIGTGEVRASGSIGIKDGTVDATAAATNIQISDWLPDYVGGLVDIRDFVVSGTLKDPQARGLAVASNLAIMGVALTNGRAEITVDKEGAAINGLTVQVPGDEGTAGVLSGAGSVEFGEMRGQFSLSASQIPSSVLAFSNDEISLDGMIEGELKGRFSGGKLETVSSDWRLRAAQLNGNPIGSGFAEVGFERGIWTGMGQIGQLDRYVQILDAKFDPETKLISGNADITNLSVRDTALILRKQIGRLSESGQRLALGATGDVSASIGISGTTDSVDIALEAFSAENLSILGRNAGSIVAEARRINKTWNVSNLEWQIDNTVLRADGIIDEGGDTDASIDVYNFDLSWIKTIYASAPNFLGTADLSAFIKGPTKNPTIIGSAQSSDISYVNDQGVKQNLPIAINLDSVNVANNRLAINGTFNVDGFAGTILSNASLSALAPYDAEQGLDESSDDFSAQLNLIKRDFDDLAEFAPWIDLDRSRGNVGGKLAVTKQRGQFVVDGQIGLQAGALAGRGFNATFEDLAANLQFSDAGINLSIESRVNETGKITLNAASSIEELFTGGLGFRDKLARAALQGSATFENVVLREANDKRDFVFDGGLGGTLDFSGSLLNPILSGDLGLKDLSVSMLGDFVSSGEAPKTFINPSFSNVRIYAQTPARIRTGTADVIVLGSGTVNGDLEAPLVNSLFTLQSGMYQLPLSRIRLDKGGTIQFTYDANPFGESIARLDVDLDGTTRIVAAPVAGQFESYEVDLKFRGNLLEEGGVTILATSDPPGLTQAQILAAIGQAGVLEEFAQGKFREGVGILFGQYFPQLIGRQTAELARSLQLDYLSLEYSPSGSFVLTGAKSLGKNLVLQMSREIAGRIQEKPRYEVKLNYRIPVKNVLLEKTRVGLGFDQDNPWKFTLTYGTRLWSFPLSKRTSDGKTWQRVWP